MTNGRSLGSAHNAPCMLPLQKAKANGHSLVQTAHCTQRTLYALSADSKGERSFFRNGGGHRHSQLAGGTIREAARGRRKGMCV